MKSKSDIEYMLFEELNFSVERINSIKKDESYYNHILGNTSFLLATLIELLLVERHFDWDNKKWMDDSLISDLIISENFLLLEGVMIWGGNDTTEQWTEPFKFIIKFNEKQHVTKDYTFYFSDKLKKEIPYSIFLEKRSYWKSIERDWKYIINSDKT